MLIPGGKDSVVSTEPVNVAVLQRQCHHSLTLAIFHYEVRRKVLDVVICVVLQRLRVNIT